MRLKCLVIVVLALLFSGCNRATPETSVSSPTPLPSPLPTSTPLNDFDEAVRFVKNGQFTYIWVFTRKDGKPFDASDSAVLKARARQIRSEEHTSELQSRLHLVCRLLLEKKNILH